MLNTKVNLHGTISAKSKMSGNLNSGIEKVYPSLENLEIVPSGEKQEFNHPNYYGYDNVKVKAIELQDKIVMPNTEEQVIVADENYSGLNQVTIEAVTSKIDNDIQSSNIKKGVNILGVDGILEAAKPKQNKEVTPSKEEQVITADEGYDLGIVTVDGDGDLIPDNIKEGKEIFGVVGTAKTTGYEFEDIDPVNIVQLLDNDNETYDYKAIVLLLNLGTNNYVINKDDFLYNTGDLIRGSDGQEMTVSDTYQTYIFDENKDLINSLGEKVRYFVVYKNSRVASGNAMRYQNSTYMYYFKNCEVIENGTLMANGNNRVKAVLFDEKCTLRHASANMGSNCYTLIKYDMPDDTVGTVTSLASSYTGCYSLKKSKLNLHNSVINLSSAYSNNYALKEILLINCPTEAVNVSQMVSSCYSLEKIIAKPVLKPYNLANNLTYWRNLRFLSGIDFSEHTSNITTTFYNLETVENISNINFNFTLSNSWLLSPPSIKNIINALVDLTGQEAKTLTLGSKLINKVSDEEKAIAINKNWNVA